MAGTKFKLFLATTLLFMGLGAEAKLAFETCNSGETILKADPRAEGPIVRVLVSPFAKPNKQSAFLEATISELENVFGKGHLEVKVSSGEPEDFAKADLAICSAGTYLRTQNRSAQVLATLASHTLPNPNHAEGSVFVTLKSREDLKTLSDLQHQRLAITGSNAFAGYHIALSEISNQGYNADKFFGPTVETGYSMQKTLDLLRNNVADVAIVRTCFLEELAQANEKIDDFKPLHIRPINSHPAGCLTSTDLYPNWMFVVTANLAPENAYRVARAIFSMPSGEDGMHWGVAADLSATDAMFKSIRHGPYEYLRTWNLALFWQHYKTSIVFSLCLLAALIIHTLRTRRLLAKRTRDLTQTIQTKHELEKQSLFAKSRMETLQRAGVLGQMSSIVAHELRQPLSSIIGYAHGLERLLDAKGNIDNVTLGTGISAIRSQAEAAEKIIQKICQYARGEGKKATLLDARVVLQKAVSTIEAAHISSIPLQVNLPLQEVICLLDPMEMELALQNLIKNAIDALSGSTEARVVISLSTQSDEIGTRYAVFSVRDNGPRLSDENFAKLSRVLSSSKLDGLGLGLTIVKLIAENHGGRLEFIRNDDTGLTVKMLIPEHRAN